MGHASLELAADDSTIARSVAAGDRSAFALIMRRYNRRLYRLARASLRDDAEAKDALQEAWLNAYRTIGRFRGDAALSTWLTRIVRSECLARHFRAQGLLPEPLARDVHLAERDAFAFHRNNCDAMVTSVLWHLASREPPP